MLENLITELTGAVAHEFAGRSAGHCLRVDNLTNETASRLCGALRSTNGSFQTFVLSLSPANGYEIRADQAIELRNQKNQGLCIIIPAALGDATASSLANSFAIFDLDRFLRDAGHKLEHSLGTEVQGWLRRVRSQLKGRASVSHEDLIGLYLAVRGVSDAAAVGRELWRVGLIPDPAADFVQRLAKNRKCVDAIARPARPQNSAAERLSGLGLPDGAFKRRLASFLSNRVLHRTEDWQRPIATEPALADLAFPSWPFPDQQTCPLQSIAVEPFRDVDGKKIARCKLEQPNGPGTSLQAQIGTGKKVAVQWTSDPPAPVGVTRWRLEMVPSRREYGEEPGEHLALTVARNSNKLKRSASISLQIDEETTVRAVEIRISAETADGYQAQDETGNIIYGYSDEFWLTTEIVIPEGVRPRKKTEICLPMARLRSVLDVKEPHSDLEESQPVWDESDEPWYFSAVLEERILARVAVSPVCAQIEDAIRENPRNAWPTAEIESDRVLTLTDVAWDALPGEYLEQKCWGDFLRQRELLVKEMSRRSPRERVASLVWDDVIADRARKYAKSYRDLLESAEAESRTWALRVDTLQLAISYPGGHRQTSAVVLPLHPLRFLWYSAYASLLEHWRKELAQTGSRSERSRRIEIAGVERLAALNVPMYAIGPEDRTHVFAQNLGFHLGVALPADTKEPGRALSEVAYALGLPADFDTELGFPVEKLGSEFVEYRRLHPYGDTLRVSISNPGDGYQAAIALSRLYEDFQGALPGPKYPKIDIVAHASDPLPLTLPGLDRLRDQLYASDWCGKASHLSPIAQVAIRSVEQLSNLPGGDVNLSLLIDESKPELRCSAAIEDQDSASIYGLLTRIASDFRSTGEYAEWTHQVPLPLAASREKHPVQPAYTPDLIDTHRAVLECVKRHLDEAAGADLQPSLTVRLGHEQRNRLDLVHHGSDWVILLDRFIGVDLFDDPADPYLAATARRYLLDYAPEFVEGLGHRLVVTTAWREEVEEVLSRAMQELGFSVVEESVSEALQALKSVSGRLALRLIHDNTRAREAASLGVVITWLKASGELDNSILIPVDAHPEIFSTTQNSPSVDEGPRGALARCDLVQVKMRSNRMDVTFIEVKSRANRSGVTDLMDRMCDQMDATENRFRELFFSPETRVDHVLQRSKLAAVFRFYARRAARYGFFGDANAAQEAFRLINRLEGGIPHLRATHKGFIVDLDGHPQKPVSHRGAQIRILTALDFTGTTVIRTPPENADRGATIDVPVESAAAKAASLPETVEPVQRPDAAVGAPTVPSEIEVALGAAIGGEPVRWTGGVKGSPHLFILGIPGQGKSWTVTRLLSSMACQGLPAIVIDFHGQFGTESSPYFRAAHPAVWDATKGLPFSPFEAVRQLEGGASYWKTNCFSIAEIFQYVFGLGDIQRGLIYDAMHDCYKEAGFENGESTALPTLADLERKIRHLEERRGIRNVLVRCKPIFDFRLFNDVSEPGSSDLLSASRGGLVIDLHRHSLEQLQISAGAFVLRKLYKDMFRWGETDRLRLAIVLDEAHRLSKDITLPKLMKEGRKFGIVVVSASQGVADFHPDVLGNAGTKIIFRTNFPASKKVAGFLKPRREENLCDRIEQLPVGTALVQTPEMMHAVQTKMFPPDAHVEEANAGEK